MKPLIALLGLTLLLTGCASTSTTTEPTSESTPTSDVPKQIARDDLREALLAPDDLNGDGWVRLEETITIGKADGRQWQPAACGENFTELFDQRLAPEPTVFLSVTYEQPQTDNFRVVTENISLRERPIDVEAIAEDFASLADECPMLTEELIALELTALPLSNAAGMRIEYKTGILGFNLDIGYAMVGTYLVGVTVTGVETSTEEMQSLLDTAVEKLNRVLQEAKPLDANVGTA
jgi:hypothetical protein